MFKVDFNLTRAAAWYGSIEILKKGGLSREAPLVYIFLKVWISKVLFLSGPRILLFCCCLPSKRSIIPAASDTRQDGPARRHGRWQPGKGTGSLRCSGRRGGTVLFQLEGLGPSHGVCDASGVLVNTLRVRRAVGYSPVSLARGVLVVVQLEVPSQVQVVT